VIVDISKLCGGHWVEGHCYIVGAGLSHGLVKITGMTERIYKALSKCFMALKKRESIVERFAMRVGVGR
jgi:hypothetical protein